MDTVRKIISLPATYIDRTPMYMVVVQALTALILYSVMLSILGILPYTVMALGLLVLITVGVSLAVNVLCAKATAVPAQHLSAVISALIIVFIASPVVTVADAWFVAVLSAVAMASKYVLVFKKQHIVNPVAVGAVVAAWIGFGGAVWWVATPLLFIPVVVAGALVVTKVRRWPMVIAFLVAGYAMYWFEMWRFDALDATTWSVFWVSYPMLFLGFFMLTEPFTMPGTKRLQIVYGVLVGLLANTSVFNSVMAMTPELALVVGNLAVYPWTLRQKLMLTVKQIREVTPSIFEFTFHKPAGMHFIAGQYLEWMVPHQSADARGIRRYFTIASSPEDQDLVVTMKIPVTKASTYKQAMRGLENGDIVIASQLAGDFILPHEETKKLAWVAGGIGITPFVSQAKTLVARSEVRDIALLYATITATDQTYADVVGRVARIIPVVKEGVAPPGGELGYVSADIISRRVPDYKERYWYVSGPPPMVTATTRALRSLGVSGSHIKTDFFPGLA